LVPGPHRFRVSRSVADASTLFGFGGPDDDEADAWETVEVADGATVTLRLREAPSAAVTGVVREDGMPLVGATVSFVRAEPGRDRDDGQSVDFGGGASAETDDGGRYELSDLPAGHYAVRVDHPARRMTART